MKKLLFFVLAGVLVSSGCKKDTIAVKHLLMNKRTMTLNVGSMETLTATVRPVDATNKNVEWSSDAPAVATVDQTGEVTGVAPGTATITATGHGGKTGTCTVTVSAVITMTTAKTGLVEIRMAGTGPATIDWGEGSVPTEIEALSNSVIKYTHTYSSSTPRTITITGDVVSLECSSNQLTALEVGNSPALVFLGCTYNKLTALDVSKNVALTELYCFNNQLASLDISGCSALIDFVCDYNQLPVLDVSNNLVLESMRCVGNRIDVLDVSKNTALTALYCGDNRLTALDVSNNTALVTLDCFNNRLTALDVSMNKELWDVLCYANRMSAEALNEFMTGLPAPGRYLYIWGNPGEQTCDTSIARAKGWTIRYW